MSTTGNLFLRKIVILSISKRPLLNHQKIGLLDNSHALKVQEARLYSVIRRLFHDDSLQTLRSPALQETKVKDFETPEIITTQLLRGEDIQDVPTSYIITGTYVDLRIAEGFKYRVRLNPSQRFLFGGQAVLLKKIGIGYGKRITFDDKSLNSGNNYFWSDTHPGGYGFSIEALRIGDQFVCGNLEDSSSVCLKVTNCSKEQIEVGMIIRTNGDIEKTVHVQFYCEFLEFSNLSQIYLSGLVFLVKRKNKSAEVEKIILKESVFGVSELWPYK